MYHTTSNSTRSLFVLLIGLMFSLSAFSQESLFEYIGPPDAVNLPEHAVAGQEVRVNRRALQSPRMSIELFGESHQAIRTHIDRQKAGQTVWTGHLEGNPGNSVILTVRGNTVSGFIQNGLETYRIGASSSAGNRLFMLDLQLLPADDVGAVPLGDGDPNAALDAEPLADNTVQDLLVVYNQPACNSAGSCAQLQADIVTAVADINSAYSASGVNITMNLVGTALTNYSGTGASATLSALAGTSDGQMDEVHQLRDDLGADVVALIYDGDGCGIGYSPASASSAFTVTDEPCLVGNRTMAHEIGHNQGALHDRKQHGGGTVGAYKYGYRRCNDSSDENLGSPYFRTFMSYACSGAPRVGRVSNPNVTYLGVSQGIDPAVDPAKGAWNARVLNESASYVAGFRTATTPPTPPAAPSSLSAAANGPDSIDISWADNSSDENNFVLQSSPDGSSWSNLATLGANATSHSDNGLNPESTHYYRVQASNSAGASAFSNIDSATTSPLPASIQDVANGEVLINGSVSGSYTATNGNGGAVQTLTELHSGGPKKSRKQSYQHAWTFDVFGGNGGVVVMVDAWVSGSEGANFYYSTDGGASRNLMFSVNNTSSNGGQTFTLPAGTSGAVRIEVMDATQTNGEAVDSLTVDYIVITSYTDAGNPPASPSAMSVTGTTSNSVSLQFMDNSEDEFGFELWRATSNPSGNCEAGAIIDSLGSNTGTGQVTHTDTSVSPSSTYWYWTRSFNGAGDNGSCSNAASGTTAVGAAISLSVNGYKVKGKQTVDLTWSGASGGTVDIYRDGSFLLNTANDASHTDSTNMKGGGTLTYEICEQGSTTSCSDAETAIF
jgi:hypothetical protein